MKQIEHLHIHPLNTQTVNAVFTICSLEAVSCDRHIGRFLF